jgi:hypothetical protein
VYVHRGQLDEARRMSKTLAELEGSADLQERCYYDFATAQILLAERKWPEALLAAERVFAERKTFGFELDAIKEALAIALQAALELHRLDTVDRLLTIVEQFPPGRRPQFVEATAARFRARLAARAQDAENAERLFKRAGGLFEELEVPFYRAVAGLEHAEWLAGQTRFEEAEPLLARARETFERLEARPWIERTAQIVDAARVAEAVSAEP